MENYGDYAMYNRLNPAAIIATIERLGARIEERFSKSSLGSVNSELLALSVAAEGRAASIAHPRLVVRGTVGALMAILFGGLIWILSHARLGGVTLDLAKLVQVLEPAFNLVILLGIAIAFLLNIERRMKRVEALRALNELRSLAHVIDMHQLTKDPERPLARRTTPSSPSVKMSMPELRRYLDYCSEMLSLTGKVAALFVQDFHDPVALGAVNEVQSFTTGLSRKIWQKILILHTISDET